MSVIRRAAAITFPVAVLLAGCQGSGQQDPASTPTMSTQPPSSSTSAPRSIAPSSPTPTAASGPSGASGSTGSSAAGTGAPEQIPEPFRGSWNLSPQDCGTESEGRLEIEADRITFYESRGEVTRLSREGEILTTVLALTGEGTRWTETYRWQLSADGAQLTELGTGSVRRRCPGS